MTDIAEQVTWGKTAALAVVAPERCVLEVKGGDRLSWLNGLLTCDLATRQPGDVVHGLAVAQKGKIVTDAVVVVDAERVLLVVQRATVDTLVASFEHHLMMEDAELARSDSAVVFLHGPRALEVLGSAREAGGVGGPFDLTGNGGAIVVASNPAIVEAIRSAAVRVGGGEGDEAGWDALRVRSSVARFGVDFDETTYPQEAALETKAVSFQKGCYLGQEVVCMLEMRGHVKRKLVTLAIDGGVTPAPRAIVTDAAGAAVGEVTSLSRLPGDACTAALAMVKYAFIASGTELRVDGQRAVVG